MNLQQYILICLVEECAELTKDCAKALRFGLDDKWQDYPLNRTRIKQEANDVVALLQILSDLGVDAKIDVDMVLKKIGRVFTFAAYSVLRGELDANVDLELIKDSICKTVEPS